VRPDLGCLQGSLVQCASSPVTSLSSLSVTSWTGVETKKHHTGGTRAAEIARIEEAGQLTLELQS